MPINPLNFYVVINCKNVYPLFPYSKAASLKTGLVEDDGLPKSQLPA
jgi:hypothetical protein